MYVITLGLSATFVQGDSCRLMLDLPRGERAAEWNSQGPENSL